MTSLRIRRTTFGALASIALGLALMAGAPRLAAGMAHGFADARR